MARIRGNEYRTTLVCIDSYESSVMNGRFYNPYHPEGIAFQSTVQFLLKLEKTLDTMEFPQSFSAVRTFSSLPAPEGNPPPDPDVQQGDAATFAIRILFRQNASWQGSITWLDGKMEQSFRSVFELILLMDNALQSAACPA